MIKKIKIQKKVFRVSKKYEYSKTWCYTGAAVRDVIISSLYKQCCEGGTAHLEGGYKYQVEDLLQEES